MSSPTPPSLETSLRSVLQERSAGLDDPPASFAAVRSRARRIRLRRLAAVAASTVAGAVVAAAIVLPLSLRSDHDRSSLVPIQAPTAPPSRPSTTPTAAGPAGAAVTSWHFRGDAAVRDALIAAARTAFAAVHPGVAIRPLWAGTAPAGGARGLIFVADGRQPRIGTVINEAGRTRLVRDDLVVSGTTEVDQQLPGTRSEFLVVLGAPGTSTIVYSRYPADRSPRIVRAAEATFAREPAPPGKGLPSIQLQNAHGAVAYVAPLSAGGFLDHGNPRHSVRELVVDDFLQARLAGDRAAASAVATPAAVDTLFAIPLSLHYVGGDCTDGPTPATCHVAGRNFTTQPSLVLTVNGGASAGYEVTDVLRGTE